MFIGREEELAAMSRLYDRGDFQLFVLYGRRRVGKTTLLTEFCRNKSSIFYSAEQSNDKMNLEKFSEQIFIHYGETALEPFGSWENAIRYINDRQTSEQLVLVFDEFPYLANQNHALLSSMQHLIDHTLKSGKLFIVLCGSYMGFMEKEVLGAKSPLFGRRTAQLHLHSFDYSTSIRFLNDFTEEEKLMLYGAAGGTAMYLQQMQSGKTLKENITDTFLRPTGYLYEEPLLLLRQEVQEPGVYSAIIETIAGGASKANEIATGTGEEPAKCLKYIKTLIELGIIYKETPFGEKESSRRTFYCISDLMFRFWYRYVLKNKTLLETGACEIVWNRRIVPDYSNYMGLVFERICREYLLRKNSRGELPLLFTSIGRWWGTDPNSRSQVEIDIIAEDNGEYMICECKWKNTPVGLSVLNDLRKKSDIFRKNRRRTWYALFSKSGFTPSLIDEAKKTDGVLLIDLADITAV